MLLMSLACTIDLLNKTGGSPSFAFSHHPLQHAKEIGRKRKRSLYLWPSQSTVQLFQRQTPLCRLVQADSRTTITKWLLLQNPVTYLSIGLFSSCKSIAYVWTYLASEYHRPATIDKEPPLSRKSTHCLGRVSRAFRSTHKGTATNCESKQRIVNISERIASQRPGRQGCSL